jgi:hypothetical protein
MLIHRLIDFSTTRAIDEPIDICCESLCAVVCSADFERRRDRTTTRSGGIFCLARTSRACWVLAQPNQAREGPSEDLGPAQKGNGERSGLE